MIRNLLCAILAVLLISPTNVRADAVSPSTVGSLVVSLGLLDNFLTAQIGAVQGSSEIALASAQGKIRELITTLSETYKDNLDVTLTSIDSKTTLKLIEVNTAVNKWNNQLSGIIGEGGVVAENVLTDIRRTIGETETSLRSALDDFSFTAGAIVNLSVYGIIKAITVSFAMIGLTILAVVAAFRKRDIPIIGYSAGVLLLLTCIITLTPIGRLMATQHLEISTKPIIAAMYPAKFAISEETRFTAFGTNLSNKHNELTPVNIAGVYSGSIDARKQNMISGMINVSPQAPEGKTDIVFQDKEKTTIRREVELGYRNIRTLESISIKIKGSKSKIEQSEISQVIQAKSAWGYDDGVRKEGQVCPPSGFTIDRFTSQASATLGPNPKIASAEQQGNCVHYTLTASHGPWYDKYRNFTNLNITVFSHRGVQIPASVEIPLQGFPKDIAKGVSTAVVDLSTLNFGDVETREILEVSFSVRHPNGTVSNGAQTFRFGADGDSAIYQGVVVQLRGAKLLATFQ